MNKRAFLVAIVIVLFGGVVGFSYFARHTKQQPNLPHVSRQQETPQQDTPSEEAPKGYKSIHQIELEQHQASVLQPDPSIPEMQNGIALARDGDWESASKVFESLVEKYPDSSETHFNLGVTYNYVAADASVVHDASSSHQMLKKAEEEVRKAYLLKPNEVYKNELQDIVDSERSGQKNR